MRVTMLLIGILYLNTTIFSQCSASSQTDSLFVTENLPISFTSTDPIESSLTIAGYGSYIERVEVYTAITHSFIGDLDIKLLSPSGKLFLLTQNYGGNVSDGFQSLWWSGNANLPISDWNFQNAVPTILSPMQSLESLEKDNPNGEWTLLIDDHAIADDGILLHWGLKITHTESLWQTESLDYEFSIVNESIPDLVAKEYPLLISGYDGLLSEIELYTEITHTYSADLDIRLRSPLGTTVVITTDNGGSSNDLYNGTLWSDRSPTLITTLPAADGGVASLQGEGLLSAFEGENPNGYWVLMIYDDFQSQSGDLVMWGLNVTQCQTDFCPIVQSDINLNPSSICAGDMASIAFDMPCNMGLITNGLTGALTNNETNFNITNGQDPFCELTALSAYNYKVISFIPRSTHSYTFDYIGYGNGYILHPYLALYQSPFDPTNPCGGRLAQSDLLNAFSSTVEYPLKSNETYYLVIANHNNQSGQYAIDIDSPGDDGILIPDQPAINAINIKWNINGATQPDLAQNCGEPTIQLPLNYTANGTCEPQNYLLQFQVYCQDSQELLASGQKNFRVYPSPPSLSEMIDFHFIDGQSIPTIIPLNDCMGYYTVHPIVPAVQGSQGIALYEIAYGDADMPSECCTNNECNKEISAYYDTTVMPIIPTLQEWGLLCLFLLTCTLLSITIRARSATKITTHPTH